MARDLHSDILKEYTESLSPRLDEGLEVLCNFLNSKKLKVRIWDEYHIAVPFKINVLLPPRGNYKGIDIRSEEDILFVFNKASYPDLAPQVYSDRKNFPKNGISHLYVSALDAPAPFCLVRGSYNEWFSNKGIIDLVIRVKNWLKDAANGSLVEDGGQFDPMRLRGYRGNVMYKYNELAEAVENDKSFIKGKSFALLLFKEKEKPGLKEGYINYPGYQIIKVINDFDELKKTYKPIIEKLAQDQVGIRIHRLLIGAVIWSDKNETNDQFPNELPKDLNELFKFSSWAGIELSKILAFLPHVKVPDIKEFPLILAVKRPKPLIGYTSDTEFFNFYLTIEEDSFDKDKLISKNLKVGFQKHNEPMSIQKAQEVSGSKGDLGNIVVFGCGAVGSKVMMHLIRSGSIGSKTILLDPDKVEPHNMVRYGLLTDSIGMNKAIALQKTAEELYSADNNSLDIQGLPFKGNIMFEIESFENALDTADWIMDFTASSAFENYFIKQDLKLSNKVTRASIMDEGQIGLLLVEGEDRNPRIDDLKVLFQTNYLEDSNISEWLQREYDNSKKDSFHVNVGVGCNSETTILSDDIISIHSGSFVQALKSERNIEETNKGIVFVTFLKEKDGFSLRSDRKLIMPLRIFKNSDNGWEVRMKAGLDEVLRKEMDNAGPIETGGVLIGLVNNKTKCIHVTDIILAPPDSEADYGCFIRGIKGLKDEVDQHKNESGQTFGYIGEWHTHPNGPNGPSSKDLQTMKEFKKEYNGENITMPVFVMIVTPSVLIPVIF